MKHRKKFNDLVPLFLRNGIMDDVTNPDEFEATYVYDDIYIHPYTKDKKTAAEWYIEYLDDMSHRGYGDVMTFCFWGMGQMEKIN